MLQLWNNDFLDIQRLEDFIVIISKQKEIFKTSYIQSEYDI